MLRTVANFEEFSVAKVHLMYRPFEEWSKNFKKLGRDSKTPLRQRTGRSLENIAAVNERQESLHAKKKKNVWRTFATKVFHLFKSLSDCHNN